MSNIKFISHESLPEDAFVKEIVYLELEGKYRVLYTRKQGKNGNLFWGVPSVGVTKHGQKEYHPAFMQDSSFLDSDIRNFLEKRSWEKKAQPQQAYKPQPQAQQEDDGDLPF